MARVQAVGHSGSLSGTGCGASQRGWQAEALCIQWQPSRRNAPSPTFSPPPMTPATADLWPQRWKRFSALCVRAFHSYAGWLIGISWKRFILLSVLLLIVSGLLQNIPPFSWTYTTTVRPAQDTPASVMEAPTATPAPQAAPVPPTSPAAPADGNKRPGIHIETEAKGGKPGVNISIDDRGVRITPQARPAAPASNGAALPAASGAPAGQPAAAASAVGDASVTIHLPANTPPAVREAVEEARQSMTEARRSARDDAEAARDQADAARADADAARSEAQAGRSAAAQAKQDAKRALADARRATRQVHEVSLGEFLPSLALLWIIASMVIKISYKRQVQAEAQAAQAVETAESESLKRQVVEARMAAMQAQVEPHFLFNTLASIDHLIEVDPKRASQMQKNLIALLRASMPTMREAAGDSAGGRTRDLGRELTVIRPYLEILKVRMEERLATEIDVPEGLHSAEFPAMMLQTLVENAIKHGLEPKPEGGKLTVKAEIVHGKLSVSVTDTGLGFGRATSSGNTAGTGVGLANIRERLQLLHGAKASLTITEHPGGGTRVALAVPYKPVESAA